MPTAFAPNERVPSFRFELLASLPLTWRTKIGHSPKQAAIEAWVVSPGSSARINLAADVSLGPAAEDARAEAAYNGSSNVGAKGLRVQTRRLPSGIRAFTV